MHGGEDVKDKYVVATIGIVCVTALGVVYFIFIRQDGTALAALSSVVGAIVGYVFPKKAKG